jgi:hypothetical protein
MSTENHQNKHLMRLFAPERSEEMDHLIEETERQIANTRRFLEHLQQGEEKTRHYVEEVKATFENDLRRFERSRGKKNRS